MTIVVVTGASQGIGEAIAKAFAGEPGVKLALVSRRRDVLEAVAEACAGLGAEARAFACDVTDEAAVGEMARQIVALWGTPDVLVNNAGAFVPSMFAETSAEAFRHQIDTNLTSAFLVTKAFLEPMVERGSGEIFFMGSVASIKAYPGSVAYCAAKHGLLGLARVVREETRDKGLRVTTIMPGATLTPSWDGVDLPEARFMPAQDIAQAVLDIHKLTGRTVVEEILLRPQPGDI